MKLRLLSSCLALFAVTACATTTRTIVESPPEGTPGEETTPSEEESDDPAKQPPHSLGTIVLGESHGSGTSSKSTPIVSAVFIPDALAGRACKKTLDASCEIYEAPKCTKVTSTASGCNSNELCTFDTSCEAVCKPYATCETPCEADEVCKPASTTTTSTRGTCVKTETFDAGPLAFSGTTTSITMYPPYKFESTGQGAPFLAGASLQVQAQGATEAGFEKFDEKFTATTFLQTTPSLAKIPREKVFGTGSVPIAWAPGADTILVTVSGAGGAATCKVKDSLGTFDLPRSVVKAAQGDDSVTGGSSVSISVTRQKKEVRKDKVAKGELSLATVQPVGWLELITVSTETASYQGCASSTQSICDDVCVDTTRDLDNCGTCGNACSTGQSCVSGTCKASSTGTTCQTCLQNASAGSCNTPRTACQNDVSCSSLVTCLNNCTTTTCQTNCQNSYPAGVIKYNAFESCLLNYCGSVCP